jgi:hypothetical protein
MIWYPASCWPSGEGVLVLFILRASNKGPRLTTRRSGFGPTGRTVSLIRITR